MRFVKTLIVCFLLSELVYADNIRYIAIRHQPLSSDEVIRAQQDFQVQITHAYNIISAIAFEAPDDPAVLAQFRDAYQITTLVKDEVVTASLQQSVPQIRGQIVQTLGDTGSGVKVCIIDTGIQHAHPALRAPLNEINLVDNTSVAEDDNGHGTHVAGIIASRNTTYRGVAPDVSLLIAKALDHTGSGFTSDVIAGIDWCVNHGAKVISMSLGYGLFTNNCDTELTAIAINNAVLQGVTVVVASGNDGNTTRISSPACASSAISVGAVNKNNVRASYSNGGHILTLVAPGSSITSTYNNGGFATLSGTSMATPHVSGVAALLLAVNPSLTPAQMKAALTSTAVDFGTPGFDNDYGNGRVDAKAAFDSGCILLGPTFNGTCSCQGSTQCSPTSGALENYLPNTILAIIAMVGVVLLQPVL